jgi:hypothetical protein
MKNEELKFKKISPLRPASPRLCRTSVEMTVVSRNDSGAVSEFLIMVIRFYQVSLGRFLGGQCRFVPTCSQYAIEAIKEFGVLKGGYMAAKRIVKCHPFGGKGYDPVEVKSESLNPKSETNSKLEFSPAATGAKHGGKAQNEKFAGFGN